MFEKKNDKSFSDKFHLLVSLDCFPLQTAEEIEKLVVDEKLNPIERTIYILRYIFY